MTSRITMIVLYSVYSVDPRGKFVPLDEIVVYGNTKSIILIDAK